jgi:YesN/AraC family two-component response regulator
LREPEYNASPGNATVSLSPDQLVEALFLRNEKQVSSAIEAAVDTAIKHEMTQMAFEHFLAAVIHDKRLTFDTKSLKEELSEAVLSATTPERLKADVTQVFNQYIIGESKVELKSRVDQIQRYLSLYYYEEISSETLSARFGFVAPYLSKVFRRQTGMSPTEYLTKLRVEKAKELLETRSGILVRDVAALVGYKDPYYFSKLFKKSTNLWPSQYQEKIILKHSH